LPTSRPPHYRFIEAPCLAGDVLLFVLIDKQDIARWGWSGELNWKGAKGQARMREKIEELLREQADP
jgi:hypothetical protein